MPPRWSSLRWFQVASAWNISPKAAMSPVPKASNPAWTTAAALVSVSVIMRLLWVDGRDLPTVRAPWRRQHRLFSRSWPALAGPRGEAVLHREHRQARTRLHAALGVDVHRVGVHGGRRDHQLGGDLALREPAREQAQHLELALGQLGR